ncbi:hypothetical protein LSAT2_009388 [Lamellibrachia satsuma]|nr:hypothetical protein LSAT2_009388 [Lamellibrachia satsuma]
MNTRVTAITAAHEDSCNCCKGWSRRDGYKPLLFFSLKPMLKDSFSIGRRKFLCGANSDDDDDDDEDDIGDDDNDDNDEYNNVL